MDKRMKMLAGAIVILLFTGGLAIYSVIKKSPTVVPTKEVTFFYGRECPHCQDVEKFLKDNNIESKVNFDSLEVWHNPDNAKIMSEKAKICGLSDKEVGVPFLFAEGKCLIGTPDVESFFKQKAGL